MKLLMCILLASLSFGSFSQVPISQPVRSSGVPNANPVGSIFFTADKTLLINIEEYIDDGNQLSSGSTNNVTGKTNVVTYVKEFSDNKFDVNVFPNPAFDWITFEVPDSDFGKITFQFIDVSGEVVIDMNNLPLRKVVFNTEFMHKGTYIVRIEQESSGDWSMYKVVKANNQ